MFRGRWGIFVAIVGLAILVGLLTVSYSLYNSAQQQHPTYGYQPASNPGFRLDGVTKAPTPHYKPSCNNPDNREDADLCAQWAAVDQVAESNRVASVNARLAILTLLVTVFGTGLLLWTFDETRQTSRRELRAYVWPKPGMIRFLEDGTVKANFTLFNNGQTPAYRCAQCGNIVALPVERAKSSIGRPQGPIGERINYPLHHGQDDSNSSISSHEPIGLDDLRKVEKGELGLFVFGAVLYDDIFGREHETQFCYQITGLRIGESDPPFWQIMPFHNEAT